MAFKLAVVDDDGVYRGVVVTVEDEGLWMRSANHFPVPDAFDLPPHRYQLRRDTVTGKEAFWPLAHERDAATENQAQSVQVNPAAIARMLLNIDSGKKLSAADKRQLEEFLGTMDAQGTKQ